VSGVTSSKFFWPDWRSDPGLRKCSLSARGLWMEMLCIAAEAQPTGYVLVNGRTLSTTDLAQLAGAPEADVQSALAELDAAGVFSRDRKGRIYNRRMMKDVKRAAENQKNGKGGGNPDIRRGTVPKSQRVRPYKRTDSPAKTRRIFEKCGERCHWCKTPIVWEGNELRPDLFHVNHIIAVCDGGTNDEDNLVGSCAKCNHARARKGWTKSSDTNPDRNSDTKPLLPTTISISTPLPPRGGFFIKMG
jgi:HNH endonuclease